MWTAKWVLDSYEEGDEAVRLEMYMAFPDLRGYFDELENRPEKPVETDTALAPGKPAEGWWSHCCRLVRG